MEGAMMEKDVVDYGNRPAIAQTKPEGDLA